MSFLAFIGGTGFDLRGAKSPFRGAHDERIETRWGAANVTHAFLENRPVVFLHRHARPDNPSLKDVPPHTINYRAQIAALKMLGVTAILASSAVGGLRPQWPEGTLVCLDDLLDFTSQRPKTFFDGRAVHVDVTRPYCAHLRRLLLQKSSQIGFPVQDGGVYLCVEGPRFETVAEIRTFARWGADVVGMTGAPEAFLAREAQISYCGVSIITNLAAGLSPHPLTHQEVLISMNAALPRLATLFLEVALTYQDDPTCEARNATRGFATREFEPSDEI